MKKDKIETGQLAGQFGWYVFVNDLLDCDIPASKTERGAINRARTHYKGLPIITSSNPSHYSNSR